MKYINKRLSRTVGFNDSNAKKTEAQFIKENAHLEFTEEELKEVYALWNPAPAKQKEKETIPSKN